VCSPSTALPVAIGVEYQGALVDLKNSGIKVRQITEITRENAHHCKELVQLIDELRHLDGVKANFVVSETESEPQLCKKNNRYQRPPIATSRT
jgi:sulfatase maturation enzyme AslB (radical SAM superfamily)